MATLQPLPQSAYFNTDGDVVLELDLANNTLELFARPNTSAPFVFVLSTALAVGDGASAGGSTDLTYLNSITSLGSPSDKLTPLSALTTREHSWVGRRYLGTTPGQTPFDANGELQLGSSDLNKLLYLLPAAVDGDGVPYPAPASGSYTLNLPPASAPLVGSRIQVTIVEATNGNPVQAVLFSSGIAGFAVRVPGFVEVTVIDYGGQNYDWVLCSDTSSFRAGMAGMANNVAAVDTAKRIQVVSDIAASVDSGGQARILESDKSYGEKHFTDPRTPSAPYFYWATQESNPDTGDTEVWWNRFRIQ